MDKFTLTWNQYKENMCYGFSSLQQNEEFVDMTLAADGYFVKVHQIIVSLASPYLKELIKSAPCPHPVIFLNKISYPILCSILEYIYSGEVKIQKDILTEFIEAGKVLHIKGLQDMLPQDTCMKPEQTFSKEVSEKKKLGDTLKFKTQSNEGVSHESCDIFESSPSYRNHIADPLTDYDTTFQDDVIESSTSDNDDVIIKSEKKPCDTVSVSFSKIGKRNDKDTNKKKLQYTLSNQGSLQLVLNRYIYCLRYTYKNQNPPLRLWRCVDYNACRCNATATTRDDMVVHRATAHKHSFHDKRIMKKIKAGLIFSTIQDAETQEKEKKKSIKVSTSNDD